MMMMISATPILRVPTALLPFIITALLVQGDGGHSLNPSSLVLETPKAVGDLIARASSSQGSFKWRVQTEGSFSSPPSFEDGGTSDLAPHNAGDFNADDNGPGKSSRVCSLKIANYDEVYEVGKAVLDHFFKVDVAQQQKDLQHYCQTLGQVVNMSRQLRRGWWNKLQVSQPARATSHAENPTGGTTDRPAQPATSEEYDKESASSNPTVTSPSCADEDAGPPASTPDASIDRRLSQTETPSDPDQVTSPSAQTSSSSPQADRSNEGQKLSHPLAVLYEELQGKLLNDVWMSCKHYEDRDLGPDSKGDFKEWESKRRSCREKIMLPSSGYCVYYNERSGATIYLALGTLPPLQATHITCERAASINVAENAESQGASWAITVDEMAQFFLQHGNLTRCVAFQQTENCDPFDKNQDGASSTLPCDEPIGPKQAGYCIFINEQSGKTYRLAPTACDDTVRQFRCSHLKALVGLKSALEKQVEAYPDFDGQLLQAAPLAVTTTSYQVPQRLSNGGNNKGIVVVSAADEVHETALLLEMLRCFGTVLPIEIWAKAGSPAYEAEALFSSSYSRPLRLRALPGLYGEDDRNDEGPTVSVMERVYALLHTSFEEVLVLTPQVTPVRDPTYLFDSKAYQDVGAIFWPLLDPEVVSQKVAGSGLLWGILGITSTESTVVQDGGHFLLNLAKPRAREGLSMLNFLAAEYETLRPLLQKKDHDLVRLAWLKAGLKYQIAPSNPGTAGWERDGKYCGFATVQHDLFGEVLFITEKKAVRTNEQWSVRPPWDFVQLGPSPPAKGRVTARTNCFEYSESPSLQPLETFSSMMSGSTFRTVYYASHIAVQLAIKYSVSAIASNDQRQGYDQIHHISSSIAWGQPPQPKIPPLRHAVSHVTTQQQFAWGAQLASQISTGYEVLTTKTLTFAALARNVAYPMARSIIPLIETLGARCKDYRVLILEGGSTDSTLSILEQWSARNARVTILASNETSKSATTFGDVSQARFDKMALLGTKLLRLAASPPLVSDYTVIFDSDLGLGWDLDGIASSFGLNSDAVATGKDWGAVCSNSLVPAQNNRFYDSLAFRGHGYTDLNFRELEKRSFELTEAPMELESCFGGLTIYRTSALGNCTYFRPDGGVDNEASAKGQCEHISLSNCIRKKMNASIIFNPRQVVYYNVNN